MRRFVIDNSKELTIFNLFNQVKLDNIDHTFNSQPIEQYQVILNPDEIQAAKPTYIPPPTLTKPLPLAPSKQLASLLKEPQPINLKNVLLMGGAGFALSLLSAIAIAVGCVP